MDLLDSLGMFNQSIQYAGAQIGAVKDKKWIAKENQKARDFTLDMWNRANEYNLQLPALLMNAYKDAGLNPNLIYGSATGSQVSAASSPGHSAPNMGTKDLAKYADFLGAFSQTQQLKMQKELVNSQISLNESAEAKNIADAEESRSKIGANIQNKHLLDSITEGNRLNNAFNELTFQTRNAIMNFDAALKEQNIELVRSEIKNLDAATDNNNRMTDMRITAMAESLAMSWKQLELNERELVGRLELWAKEGDASVMNAKASFLNALTNSKAFKLEKDKFDKFSDEQLKLLKQNVTKLKTFNGWYDPMLEMQLRMLNRNYENAGKQGVYMDLQNTFFDMNMFMPLIKPLDPLKF